mmetsp:Transcript_8161/g.23323  ORF Transcript_8161/g.23323 Transcript_8161/m.23323 type:complete len:251 (-) Transcript_8161:274-1026(-)
MLALAFAPGYLTSLARTDLALPPSAAKHARPTAASSKTSLVVVVLRTASQKGLFPPPLESSPHVKRGLRLPSPASKGCCKALEIDPEATEARATVAPPTSVESTGVAHETRRTLAEATWQPLSTAQCTERDAAHETAKGTTSLELTDEATAEVLSRASLELLAQSSKALFPSSTLSCSSTDFSSSPRRLLSRCFRRDEPSLSRSPLPHGVQTIPICLLSPTKPSWPFHGDVHPFRRFPRAERPLGRWNSL